MPTANQILARRQEVIDRMLPLVKKANEEARVQDISIQQSPLHTSPIPELPSSSELSVAEERDNWLAEQNNKQLAEDREKARLAGEQANSPSPNLGARQMQEAGQRAKANAERLKQKFILLKEKAQKFIQSTKVQQAYKDWREKQEAKQRAAEIAARVRENGLGIGATAGLAGLLAALPGKQRKLWERLLTGSLVGLGTAGLGAYGAANGWFSRDSNRG